jgi:hypothetical protein
MSDVTQQFKAMVTLAMTAEGFERVSWETGMLDGGLLGKFRKGSHDAYVVVTPRELRMCRVNCERCGVHVNTEQLISLVQSRVRVALQTENEPAGSAG